MATGGKKYADFFKIALKLFAIAKTQTCEPGGGAKTFKLERAMQIFVKMALKSFGIAKTQTCEPGGRGSARNSPTRGADFPDRGGRSPTKGGGSYVV